MEKRTTVWSFFIDNPKFTALLVAGFVVFGLGAIVALPKESDPEVKIPIAVINTVFPGASVEEVEELVTNKIEDAVTGVDDIERMTSNSMQGISSVVIEFSPDADEREVIADLKDEVDQVLPQLPDQVEDPVVRQISFEDEPFLILSMAGPYDPAQLKVYAEIVERELERLAYVDDVEIVGGRDREVQVIVDRARLESFGLSLSQVTRAIAQSNNDIPIGSIETAGEDYALRFAGRLRSADEIATVPVGLAGNTPVLVQDVADVVDTFSVPTSYSHLSVNGEPAQAAVTLRVKKAPGGDITALSREVKTLTSQIVADQFPENVVVTDVQDVAQYIRDDLRNLSLNGLATVILVITLLMVFVGWREALMAGLSIPLAFLMSFIGLTIFGLTINFMTLFSLILALGILVDSAIVINEGLSKHRIAGKSPYDAAVATIHEFEYPLISGTLTTVFAFIPMLLTGGIIGEYIKTIPITVSLVLVSSLFIALAIVTTASAYIFKQGSGAPVQTGRVRRLLDATKESYQVYLRNLMGHKGARRKVWILLFAAMVAAYALPVVGAVRVEFFPADDFGFFGIDYERPFGTPLEATRDSLLEIAEELNGDPRVKNYVVNIGSTLNLDGQGGQSGAHTGHILVNLVDKNDRDQSSTEVIDEYRANLVAPADSRLTIAQQSSGPPSSAPVEIKLSGDSLEELDSTAAKFERLLSTIPGTINIRNTVVETNGQFVVHLDRLRAARFGLNATDLALLLRNAINGTTATELTLNGDDIDVTVKYQLNTRPGEVVADTVITDISTIKALPIVTPVGEVPLGTIADIRLENSRAGIEHEDGLRIVKVQSGVDGSTTALDVFAEVARRMETEIQIPTSIDVSLGGENEDTAESFGDMIRAMGVAVLLIAGLMVLQFKSYRQAILIVITIPLALIGVFPGLMLVNQPISFPGVIGIVALAGIVVNNAIILIDRMNSNRAAGMELTDAVIEAGHARIEPIILTTITTVVGILPLALTQAIWASLGYSIIFGLLFSTVTTLIVIPMLYRAMYRVRK